MVCVICPSHQLVHSVQPMRLAGDLAPIDKTASAGGPINACFLTSGRVGLISPTILDRFVDILL
jgi:hypothetical protein